MLAELKRLAQIEPVSYTGFNPIKTYFYEKYSLEFSGIWKLIFNKKIIITETSPIFWDIIETYDFKPLLILDTIGEDKISQYERDIIPEETDTNFWPSLRGDWQTKTYQEKPFPIWEWNEYIDPNLMPLYKEVV